MLESSQMEPMQQRVEASFGSGHDAVELSVVDAVLWACELSEDETEVGDLVDAVLQHEDVCVEREPGSPIEPIAARRL